MANRYNNRRIIKSGQKVAVGKLLPGMIKNRFGRILQTSSIGVKFGGGKNTFNYSLSKKLNEFLPSHVKSLANKNILVNTLKYINKYKKL